MDQVAKIVNLLKEKVPEGKILAPEVVVNVIKKKLEPSVIHNIGGDSALLAQVKRLLAPPPPPAPVQQKQKKNSASSSEDDDDSDSSDDSSDDDEDDEEDFDSDQEEDDEEEDDEEDFDDESTDSEEEKEDPKAGSRRQRADDSGAAAEKTPKPDNSANQQQSSEAQLDEMLRFLKKCGVASAVARKRNDDEAVSDYIANVVKPAFASKGLDPEDLSKAAVSRHKMRAELELLRQDGADLSLNREQRRGKPIFDSNGKVIGITGGQVAQNTSTVKASLVDEE